MKDSGIEWIGEIPQEWETKPLKAILVERKENNNPIKTDFIMSLTMDKGVIPYSEKTGGGNKAKEDLTAYKLAYPNDIVLNSMNVLAGSVGISSYFGCVSPVYYMLYPRDANYCVEYFNDIFQTKEFQGSLLGYGNGIMMKESGTGKLNTIRMRIPMSKLNTLQLPVPSINEQHRIADYIQGKCKNIDTIIEYTNATIEEYKKYKQSVITEAVTKGIDANAEMKDSGVEWIGKIPKHWDLVKMKYIGQLAPECNTEKLVKDSVVTFLPMEFVKNGYFINNETTYENWNSSYNMFENNDIIIAKVTPCFENGNIAIANNLSNGIGFGSSELFVIRVSNINNKYLLYFMQNDIFKSRGKSYMKGTGGLKRISADFIKEYYVSFPNEDEQLVILNFLDKKCEEIDKLISIKQQLIAELENYKKSLIYECATGKRNIIEISKSTEISTIVYPLFSAKIDTDKKPFAQAVLVSKIIDMANTSQFGRVKLEKILYTIETHIGFDFGTEYKRQAAGPLDRSIYKCEGIISRKNKWFNINGKNKINYNPAKDMSNYKNYYSKYFMDYNNEIERIINIFKPLSKDQSEIIATLYASWNDFIISGRDYTDNDIVNDVLNNWHVSKKRFSKDTWLLAIKQMRKNNLVPKGYGKKTVKA